jgi:MerR family transcriptional regulator, copper efflux regulator
MLCKNYAKCAVAARFANFTSKYSPMLIGQLSKLTGFSRDTIRYYEKIGLIEVPRTRRTDSNYKDYPEEIVHKLRAIRKYKDLGFTLEEIRELLVRASIQVLDVAKLLNVVELKITGIDAEIERLHNARMQLAREHQLLLRKKTSRVIGVPEMKIAA